MAFHSKNTATLTDEQKLIDKTHHHVNQLETVAIFELGGK